jgi:hypothetical protein
MTKFADHAPNSVYGEADDLSGAEAKNAWSYTSTPPLPQFEALRLIKHKEHFIFTTMNFNNQIELTL